VIIGDDQDEWFFEDNMPPCPSSGARARLDPRTVPPGTRDADVIEAIRRGYGDVPMDVPVASGFGRYLIEYLIEHDFDVAHMRYVKQPYGGSVARRYPTKQGELDYVRETSPREQGLPHAFAFIVKRLFDNSPARSCRSSRTPAICRTSRRRAARSRSARRSPTRWPNGRRTPRSPSSPRVA